MKKLLLSIALVAAGFAANAQVDTLSEFFTGTPTMYGAQGGGYVTGNNSYEDIAKGMRYNSANGLSSGGTLTNVLAWIPVTINTSGTATCTAKIYAFSSTTALGAQLGSQTLSLSSIDTTLAGFALAGGKPFNANFVFSTPVTVPNDILVMIELPTTAGDTIAIVSNTSGDWANAATHTFEIWSDNSLNNFATAWQGGVNVAMAIYPVVNMTASIEENVIEASVYPNPANDVLNIKIDGTIESVVVTTLDGKVVASTTSNAVNVNELASGMYIYTVTTTEGKIATGNFAKN